MKRSFLLWFCILVIFGKPVSTLAQNSTLHTIDTPAARYQVAVFAPLYLDSAFNQIGDYAYGKVFPKFINPGLEFYEGVQLAADSLTKIGAPLDVYIYDTRSANNPLTSVIHTAEFSTMDLIIGDVNYTEMRELADVAKNMNIPFINAVIPNAGGIINNPSFIILNSTIKTHCEAIYRFLQRNYSTAPVVLFTRKGVQEDMLKGYFSNIESTTASFSLRTKVVTLNDNFSPAQLSRYLDSNRMTMCIAATFDENFAKDLCQQLAYLNTTYPVQVMGMPTWDGIRDFDRKEYKGLEIYYTTPFYNGKVDKLSQNITTYFHTNFYSRPSDMVFRGYECLMRFGRLLVDHGPNLVSSIGEKKYKVFTDFDIQPVFLNRQNLTLDYFENRKLYFVKMEGGSVKGVY